MNRSDHQRRMTARYLEPIPPEELARRRQIPVTDEEVAELTELVRWFRRRYPTVRERFAYINRKYAEWSRHHGS